MNNTAAAQPLDNIDAAFAACAEYLNDQAADGVTMTPAEVVESYADAHGLTLTEGDAAHLGARLALVARAIATYGPAIDYREVAPTEAEAEDAPATRGAYLHPLGHDGTGLRGEAHIVKCDDCAAVLNSGHRYYADRSGYPGYGNLHLAQALADHHNRTEH